MKTNSIMIKFIGVLLLIAGMPLLNGCRTFQSRKDSVSIHDLMSHDGANWFAKAGQTPYDATLDARERRRLFREFNDYKKQLMMQVVMAKVSGRKDKAQQLLDQLLEIDPQNLKAVHLKSELAIQSGNLRLAEKILRKQMERQPHYSLCDKLAYIYYLREEFTKAQAWLQVSLSLGAPPGEIQYHLGMIAQQEGDERVAQNYYAQALSHDPGHKKAALRLQSLQLQPQTVTALAQQENLEQPQLQSQEPVPVKTAGPAPEREELKILPAAPQRDANAKLRNLTALLSRTGSAVAAQKAEQNRKPARAAPPAEKLVQHRAQPPSKMTVQVLESPRPARIVKIHKDGRFALMNKGRWDGISARQNLYLYRADKYIGQLTVSRVSSDFATLLPADNLSMQAVEVGDQVFSSRKDGDLSSRL